MIMKQIAATTEGFLALCGENCRIGVLAREGAMMWSIDTVGATAGEVWNFLSNHGPASVTTIEQEVDAPKLLVHLALGWLAREGKLKIEERKGRAFLSVCG
jgi:hypothetical protein